MNWSRTCSPVRHEVITSQKQKQEPKTNPHKQSKQKTQQPKTKQPRQRHDRPVHGQINVRVITLYHLDMVWQELSWESGAESHAGSATYSQRGKHVIGRAQCTGITDDEHNLPHP